jgi:aspartate 1-decarboxylase
MLRTFVNGKIHGLKVTGLEPTYNGSCRICPELLAAAGIEPFERVEIYSLTGTARIATYVFPGAAKGEFTLRGGAARHLTLGEHVAVVTYRDEERFSGASCVIVDPSDNSVRELLRYERFESPDPSPARGCRDATGRGSCRSESVQEPDPDEIHVGARAARLDEVAGEEVGVNHVE